MAIRFCKMMIYGKEEATRWRPSLVVTRSQRRLELEGVRVAEERDIFVIDLSHVSALPGPGLSKSLGRHEGAQLER